MQVNSWKSLSSFELCSVSAADQDFCLFVGEGCAKGWQSWTDRCPIGKMRNVQDHEDHEEWKCWGAAGTRISELKALDQEGSSHLVAFKYLNNLLGLGSSHICLMLFPISLFSRKCCPHSGVQWLLESSKGLDPFKYQSPYLSIFSSWHFSPVLMKQSVICSLY